MALLLQVLAPNTGTCHGAPTWPTNCDRHPCCPQSCSERPPWRHGSGAASRGSTISLSPAQAAAFGLAAPSRVWWRGCLGQRRHVREEHLVKSDPLSRLFLVFIDLSVKLTYLSIKSTSLLVFSIGLLVKIGF
jgi:hypothetical protein